MPASRAASLALCLASGAPRQLAKLTMRQVSSMERGTRARKRSAGCYSERQGLCRMQSSSRRAGGEQHPRAQPHRFRGQHKAQWELLQMHLGLLFLQMACSCTECMPANQLALTPGLSLHAQWCCSLPAAWYRRTMGVSTLATPSTVEEFR
jgi:hypothetical protein